MIQQTNLPSILVSVLFCAYLGFCFLSIYRVQPAWWWQIQTASFGDEDEGMYNAGLAAVRDLKNAKDKAEVLLWMTKRTNLLATHSTEQLAEAISWCDCKNEYYLSAQDYLSSDRSTVQERERIQFFLKEAH